eukprot:3629159-Pleurochrysis_carterae.AAC.1
MSVLTGVAQRGQAASRGQQAQLTAITKSQTGSIRPFAACQRPKTLETQKDQLVQTSQSSQTADIQLEKGDSARTFKLWAAHSCRDVEPQQTVDAEILAQIFNHMTLAKSSQQEPIITLSAIAGRGSGDSSRDGRGFPPRRRARRCGRSTTPSSCACTCSCRSGTIELGAAAACTAVWGDRGSADGTAAVSGVDEKQQGQGAARHVVPTDGADGHRRPGAAAELRLQSKRPAGVEGARCE